MSIRDKLAKIGFDVTEHQLKLYKALSGIEAVAEELGADPQGLSVQLGCKRQQATTDFHFFLLFYSIKNFFYCLIYISPC